MKTRPVFPSASLPALLLLGGLLLSLNGCNNVGIPGRAAPSAAKEIGYGEQKGRGYTNAYFGMSAEMPEGWYIQDKEQNQELLELGGEALAGDDANMKRMLKATELQTVPLFATFEHPPGAPVPVNNSVISVAERVGGLPGINSGQDYLYHAKQLLLQASVGYKEVDQGTTTIGGRSFDTLTMHLDNGGSTIIQDYYSAIVRDYALCFVTTYVDDEGKAKCQQVLETVAFD
ncbi:MAG: hypothetical protein AAGK14_03150 [Verrucomicrobiota bacterium]